MSEVSRYGRVFGERHPVAKLSDEDVGRIRALNARGVSYADLAEAFGFGRSLRVECVGGREDLPFRAAVCDYGKVEGLRC